MRAIKFRAWNKIEGNMVDLQKITPLALSDSMNNQLALMNRKGLFLPLDIPELVLMQYTNLNDSKDVEIYEGDIVKWDGYYFGDSWQKPWEGIVKYENGGFRISHELEENNRYIPPSFCSGDIYNYSIEIIGNLYENPELLPGKE